MRRKTYCDVSQSSVGAWYESDYSFSIVIRYFWMCDMHSIKPMSCLHNTLEEKRAARQGIPMFWHRLVQNCNPPGHYKRQLSLIAFFLCPVARSQCSQYGQYPNCPAGTGKGKSIQVKYTITYSSCLQLGTGCECIIYCNYV